MIKMRLLSSCLLLWKIKYFTECLCNPFDANWHIRPPKRFPRRFVWPNRGSWGQVFSPSPSFHPTLMCVSADHTLGTTSPSLRSVCGFFYVPYQFYVSIWRRQGQQLKRHCPMTRTSELRQMLSIQPAWSYQDPGFWSGLEFEPATFRLAVWCSTNWANLQYC